MTICPRCGAENKEGRRACWNCWTLLTEDDAPPAATPLPEVEPLPVPEPLPEPEPDPLPTPEPEPLPEVVPEPLPEVVSEPLPEAEPEPLPVPEPEPLPEPKPAPVTEIAFDDTPSAPVDDPVIESAAHPLDELEFAPEADDLPVPDEPAIEDAIPGPPVEEDGAHAHAPDAALPLANDFTFVAESVTRNSRRGERLLLGLAIGLSLLIIGAVAAWYFSFHAKPHAGAPADAAQAYLSALTAGDISSQSQLATSDSRGQHLPTWVTLSSAGLIGATTVNGDAAAAPLQVTLILTPAGAAPGEPVIPLTLTVTTSLPLARDGETWRVDQTVFFADLHAIVTARGNAVKLPAWE